MTRATWYATVNVPAEQYAIIKKWVYSGKSPYASPSEAYRSELRRMIWELELQTQKGESNPGRGESPP